jgi:hypothetical protein
VVRLVVSGAAGKSLIASLRTAFKYFSVWRADSVMSASFWNVELISVARTLSFEGLVRRRYMVPCSVDQ